MAMLAILMGREKFLIKNQTKHIIEKILKRRRKVARIKENTKTKRCMIYNYLSINSSPNVKSKVKVFENLGEFAMELKQINGCRR